MPTERTLYVVVHGVGDPEPGETVRELARGLTSTGLPVVLTEERVWLAEPDPEADPDAKPPVPGSPLARTFPVAVLHDAAHDRLLADVNWSDLSRFPGSRFGFVEGLFNLLFGLRHVAYEAAAPAVRGDRPPPPPGTPVAPLIYPGAGVLRTLGWLGVRALIGPLVATNILMVFLLAAAVVADRLNPGSFADRDGEVFAGAACVLAAVLGLLVRLLKRRREVYQVFGCWLAVVSLGVVAVAVTATATGNDGLIWAVPGYDKLQAELGSKTGGVVFYAAVATLPMGLAFLVANVSALAAAVYFFTRFWRRAPEEVQNSALAATVLPFVMLLAWCVTIPVVWSLGVVAIDEWLDEWLSPPFHAVLNALLDFVLVGLPLWFLLLVAVALAAAPGLIGWWFRRGNPDPAKRLIVGAAVLLALALGSLVIPGVTLLQLTPYGWWVPRLELQTKKYISYGIAVLPVFPFLLQSVIPPIRFGLDLIFDVVNHFRTRYPGPANATDYHIRRAIRTRLVETLNSFATRIVAGERCHLVIVSHSQGTMVAIGALNQPALDLSGFASVRLVTMGSPFGHIYQHYFRHHYPPLDDDRWTTLRDWLLSDGGPARWVNLYRTDDYIGRVIDDARTGLIENQDVEKHGHTNYWSDKNVIAQLVRLGVVRGKP